MKRKAALERHSYIDIGWVWGVGFECEEFHGKDNWKLCKNRNTHKQQGQNLFCKNVSKSIVLQF